MSVRLTCTPLALLLLLLLLLLVPAAAARAQGQEGPGAQPLPGRDARAGQADSPHRRAEVSSPQEPGDPGETFKCGSHGVVRLRAVLSADGQVTNISVIKGLPDGLTEKAIEAARRIRFTPAEDAGKKVSVVRRVEYRFPPG